MKLGLKIYRDGAETAHRGLAEGVYRIGRSEFSDIILSDSTISRSHVEIRINEASAYFTNMASPGSVKYNGKIKETAELKEGDEIQIGYFRLVFVAHEEAAIEAESPRENLESEEAAPDGEVPSEDPQNPMLEGFGGVGNLEGESELPKGPIPHEAEIALKEDNSFEANDTALEVKPIIAKILFQEGARSGEELYLEAFEVTFGRSRKADVFLDDHRLSRLHFKIIRVGNGYRLVDLNSRNGTFVNGVRVLEHPLSSFDTIEIGDTKLKFLIHDMMQKALDRQAGGEIVPIQQASEGTKSVHWDAVQGNLALKQEPAVMHTPVAELNAEKNEQRKKQITRLLVGLVIVLGLIFLVLPSGEEDSKTQDVAVKTESKDKLAEIKAPQIPKEYAELSEDMQRAVEGHYNGAVSAASHQNYAESMDHLKKIHQLLPFYKDSLSLQEKFQKKLKEAEIMQAQERAKKDEMQDLNIYLQEGMDFLSQGEFDRAAESFNSAIVIDPYNQVAAKGLKAAEAKVRRLEDVPPDVDPELDKRKTIVELFRQAAEALNARSYQEAISKAKQIQEIKLDTETAYIQEAQQIIDKGMALQKEEFEPFLLQAKEKYAEGDYNASRDLCEEMVKRDPTYGDAKECVLKAKKQLNRLAREAYTHGYILESMNRIEEAKQYWTRARNYVREGDEYYDKIIKKLESY